MSALLAKAMRVRRTAGVYRGWTFGAIVGEDDGLPWMRTLARRPARTTTPLESAAAVVICDALDLLEPDEELGIDIDLALAALARLARETA